MTIDEVTALMRWNVAMYSNSAKPLTDENAATQIAIWSAELADVPAYAGRAALQKAFTVCRFPVTLAVLCDQLRAIQTQYELPSADAWLCIQRMISRVHYYGEPPLDYSKMFSCLPAVARDWLGSYQAALELNHMTDEGRAYKRSEFERFYDKWQKTAPINPALLPTCADDCAQLAEKGSAALLTAKSWNDGWH